MTEMKMLIKIDQRLDSLEKRMDSLEMDVSSVKYTEEAISEYMRIAAENNIQFNRALNGAIMTKAEKDLMNLRIRFIRDDVNALKEKYA